MVDFKCNEYDGMKFHNERRLIYMIGLLGACNNMQSKNIIDWPLEIMFSYELLGKQAARFNEDEAMIFVDGEGLEMEKMAIEKSCRYLSRFLNQIFDGPLHDKFYFQC